MAFDDERYDEENEEKPVQSRRGNNYRAPVNDDEYDRSAYRTRSRQSMPDDDYTRAEATPRRTRAAQQDEYETDGYSGRAATDASYRRASEIYGSNARTRTQQRSRDDEDYDDDGRTARRAAPRDENYRRPAPARANRSYDEYDEGEYDEEPRRTASRSRTTAARTDSAARRQTAAGAPQRNSAPQRRRYSDEEYEDDSRNYRRAPARRQQDGNLIRNVTIAVVALALIIVGAFVIKNFVSKDNGIADAVNSLANPTAEAPFDDVFATATAEPQATDENGALVTAIPTLAPTEQPTAEPANSLAGLDPDKPAIALTFDDGPSKYTKEILATLAEYNSKATFFVVGSRLDEQADVLKMEYDAGCQIGMHTYNHVKLTTATESTVRKELNDTNEKIYSITGEYATIMRPPYGSINKDVKAILKDMNLTAINWRIDTRDWDTKNADSVYNEIMTNVSDGMIILMHDMYSSTAEAVSRAVPALIEKGYQLCTIEDLFKLKGIELEPGGVYLSARHSADE